MYAALKAYSNILRLNGRENESKFQMRRAQNLKNYYNNKWSVVEKSDKFAFAADNNGNKQYIWKNENDFLMDGESLVFVPVKYLTYPGERTNKLLKYIDECEENPDLRQSNIESLTYLPDAFSAPCGRAWSSLCGHGPAALQHCSRHRIWLCGQASPLPSRGSCPAGL